MSRGQRLGSCTDLYCDEVDPDAARSQVTFPNAEGAPWHVSSLAMEIELPDHVRDLFWRNASHAATGGPGTILGSDRGGTFIVDDHGAVQWEAQDESQPGRFASSSVDLFAESLWSVSELRDELVSMPEDEALLAVADTRDRLRTRDPAAFADNDTWWGVVFEQLQDGLL